MTLFDISDEAGVELLLHTLFAGSLVADRTVTGVQTANKDGLGSVGCGIVVDATGDGDVAYASGAPYEKGREDGYLQAVSLNFVLAGIDEESLPGREEFKDVSNRAMDSGELPPFAGPLHLGHSGLGYPPGIRHFQLDLANHIDGSDAYSLTEGERICHRRVYAIWEFL